MSGGFFNYDQARIRNMADSLEELIERNGKAKTEEEIMEEGGAWYPEDMFWHKYPAELIEEFKRGITSLRTAYVYAQRIDRLVSGDDSEETFIETLDEELNSIKINRK